MLKVTCIVCFFDDFLCEFAHRSRNIYLGIDDLCTIYKAVPQNLVEKFLSVTNQSTNCILTEISNLEFVKGQDVKTYRCIFMYNYLNFKSGANIFELIYVVLLHSHIQPNIFTYRQS